MFKTNNRTSRVPRSGGLKGAFLGSTLLLGAAAFSSGCLDRPVEPLTPNTSNVFVKAVRTSSIDKIDLVFMIDNSISMADKQAILKEAVPNLLQRLIQPDCVDQDDNVVTKNTDGSCPDGSKEQFRPVNNIHIAAITSALGAHGGEVCANTTPTVDYPNDMAHLMPSIRPDLPASDPAGFLAWNGGGQDLNQLLADFQSHVVGAGERGCGYEASLEAWYRFLVDPTPPKNIVKTADGVNDPERANGLVVVDDVLLAQRNAFLRSDSLVAIIMLSDENDCSILDLGNGWAVSTPGFQFKPAATICDTKPDDKCCYSCFGGPPDGCAADAACGDANARIPAAEDRGNVRCAQQKMRFGLELLWPTDRYIDGLTQTQIVDEWDPAKPVVANPLFISRPGADGQEAGPRDPSLVFLAGIIGVPWQDIATEDSQAADAGLTYLTSQEIRDNGVWDKILGNVGQGVLPTDMRMFESITPRAGLPDFTAAGSDPIHGNDYDNSKTFAPDGSTPANDDLQYACIFPLVDPIDCTDEENKNRCDCFEPADLEKVKPLCQNGQGAPQENTQYFAKAYPGTRFLEVLKGIEDKAIVASICPKKPAAGLDPDAGYNPAVGAIIKRLGEVLGGQCLPRELDVNPTTGKVDCLVIEASSTLGDPECARPGREDVDSEVAQAVRNELTNSGACGGETGIACSSIQMCGIRQFTSEADKQECFTNASSTNPGYCYIDPAKGPEAGGQGCDGPSASCTNPFVENCPAEQRRILRFVGTADAPVPAKGAITLTACVDS